MLPFPSRYPTLKTLEADILINGGVKMGKESQEKKQETNQPKPLSGSHKVKNRNHSRQNKNPGHGM